MHDAPVTAVTVHKRTGRILAGASDGSIIAITSGVRGRACAAQELRRAGARQGCG